MKLECVMHLTKGRILICHPAFCCTCVFLLWFFHVAANSHAASAPPAFTGPSACTSYPQDGKQIWFHRRAVRLELRWLGRSRATMATSTYPPNQRRETCCFLFCSLYFSLWLYILHCCCAFNGERYDQMHIKKIAMQLSSTSKNTFIFGGIWNKHMRKSKM